MGSEMCIRDSLIATSDADCFADAAGLLGFKAGLFAFTVGEAFGSETPLSGDGSVVASDGSLRFGVVLWSANVALCLEKGFVNDWGTFGAPHCTVMSQRKPTIMNKASNLLCMRGRNMMLAYGLTQGMIE